MLCLEKERELKKREVILIGVVLSLALIGFLVISLLQKETGSAAIVTVDGEEYGRYALSQKEQIVIDTDWGHNVLVVSGEGIYMQEADCPDQICVHKGEIQMEHETIVCLPHRIVVEIRSDI